jgi:hypothetical protein
MIYSLALTGYDAINAIPEAWVTAVIGPTLVVVVGAFVGGAGWLLKRAMDRKMDRVLHQVENSHSTNLRDDMDKIHLTMSTLLHRQVETQRTVLEIQTAQAVLTGRQDDLEQTVTEEHRTHPATGGNHG